MTTVPITLSTFLASQSLHLIDDGWEVHWASSGNPGSMSLPEGVIYHSLPLSRSPSAKVVIESSVVLYQLFRTEQFSIIQYSSPTASLCASVAAVVARVPVRIYAQWGIRYVGFEGFSRRVLKSLEKLTCRLSTVIQPDSFGNLRFAVDEKLYPLSKGNVVRNGSACGVDFQIFDLNYKQKFRDEVRSKYGISNDSFVFGFVGSVRTDKGINETVLAFSQLPDDFQRRSKLLLVGDTDFISDLSPEVQSAVSRSENILTTGPVAGVERYISAFDCLVFPSYREGFGMVVIESAAMAVPAIVTDIPGPSEAVVDGTTGRIIPLKDVEALKSAMQVYISNPTLALEQGLASRKLVEEKYERGALMSAFVENKQALLNQAAAS